MVKREQNLLSLCIKYLTASKNRSLPALSIPDWDCLLETANNHGISPLLYHNLTRIEEHVQPEVMELLKELYYLNTIRNDFFYSELGRILKSLKEANIETIVMKGAVLAELIYLERGLRPFSDMDILIKKDSLDSAGDELTRLGYILDAYTTPRGFSERFDYHHRYTKGESVVELHWDLSLRTGVYKYTKIKVEDIWRRARVSRIAGIDVLIPSPEDLIIHSCIHSAKHKYSRLIWSYDIQQIVKCYQIDWEYLIMSTKSDNTEKHVFYGLFFAEKLLGQILPRHVLDELRPPAYEVNLFRFFIYHESPGIVGIARDMVLRLLLINRQIDRLRLLVTYPAESLVYLLLGNKKRTLRRLREGTVGL